MKARSLLLACSFSALAGCSGEPQPMNRTLHAIEAARCERMGLVARDVVSVTASGDGQIVVAVECDQPEVDE